MFTYRTFTLTVIKKRPEFVKKYQTKKQLSSQITGGLFEPSLFILKTQLQIAYNMKHHILLLVSTNCIKDILVMYILVKHILAN